jgi:hypothetical protein
MSSLARVCGNAKLYASKYNKLGILIVKKGSTPAMISERAKGVIRILEESGGLFKGKTHRCEFEKVADSLREKHFVKKS